MINIKQPEPIVRQKIPKDGPGPRGLPDCYYVSRVLNSTFRYERFVRKLRQEEEETRKGDENNLIALKDRQRSDFFIRCDRRSLINDVARRVDLCMASYEQDLDRKRRSLTELLSREEEINIRKFVEQAQAGAELVWQDKKDRLQYLLEKRKKEHEDKFKDTPLSKCAHVMPCIIKLHAKEAEEIQLYQIREKQARKLQEKEFDKMWCEVAMKESEALAARMEQDAIDRLRRDLECKDYADYQIEMRRQQQEKDKELAKEEAKMFRSMWEEDNRKEEEAERLRTEKRLALAEERKEALKEKQQLMAEKAAEDKLIEQTWDSLTTQGINDERDKAEWRKRKERDIVDCNRRIVQLKLELEKYDRCCDALIAEESKVVQDIMDGKRCRIIMKSRKANKECREIMNQQILERKKAREELKKKIDEEGAYMQHLYRQMVACDRVEEIRKEEIRKDHQRNLIEQIEYNKLLKERALKEQMEEMEKCKRASVEYQEEINKMLCRPFFSDDVHAFMKQMAKGLEMRPKCPCSKPDYCAP